jgi:heme/copper-type cytochrome/quinol oxidase subunit 2
MEILLTLITNIIVQSDAPSAWQYGLQDPATSEMLRMVELHNNLMNCLIMIGFFVLQFLCYTCETYNVKNNKIVNPITHSSVLEIFWTLFPAGLLLYIALPSFSQMYNLDQYRYTPARLDVKIIGHQWYWSYEMTGEYFRRVGAPLETPSLAFDSYMLKGEQLIQDDHLLLRLLETDQCLQLPSKSRIKLLITSSDVLHSWSVPSFGIKVDACPGRLSQANIYIRRPGIFYGQCSELCGINHGFMPIHVNVTESFVYFLAFQTFFGGTAHIDDLRKLAGFIKRGELLNNLSEEDGERSYNNMNPDVLYRYKHKLLHENWK